MSKIITYRGSMDTLVWHKEYKSLDCDAEVVVPVAHEAVFIRDGRVTDSFSMGRHILREGCIGAGHLFADEADKADCRVYYVKKEGTYTIKWSAPSLRINDPVLKIPVEFDISGVFAIKIIDAKRFLSRLLAFTKKAALDEVKEFFRGRMLIFIKDQLIAALAENKISIIELPRKLMIISKDLELRMRYVFESFGISIEGFMLKKTELLCGGESCEGTRPACAQSAGDKAGLDDLPPESLADKAGLTDLPPESAGDKAGLTDLPPESAGEALYCPKCGVDLPPLSVFCLKCGAKIE